MIDKQLYDQFFLLCNLNCYKEAQLLLIERKEQREETSSSISNLLALSRYLQKNFEQAEKIWNSSLIEDPSNLEARNNLSLYLFEIGCYQEAQKILNYKQENLSFSSTEKKNIEARFLHWLR